MSDQDDLCAERLGLVANRFLVGRDEGGDKDSPLGGAGKPTASVVKFFLRSEFRTNFHCLFVGVPEKKEVAVGFILPVADCYPSGSLKEPGKLSAHG